MKEYRLYDICAELEILMIGGLKPEYYIRKSIFLFLFFDKVINSLKTTHTVSPTSYHIIYTCDQFSPSIRVKITGMSAIIGTLSQ